MQRDKLVLETGYSATSVQDLVCHLGISRASFYSTNRSKQAYPRQIKLLEKNIRNFPYPRYYPKKNKHLTKPLMSFLAKLFINGRSINVLDTNVHFYQRIHPSTFQPTSAHMGGTFTVTIETGSNTDLLRLMVAPETMCNGFIRFYKRDAVSKLMDYEFFDTYIVGYLTEFISQGTRPMTNGITFSPGILRIGDMVFEKHWKVTELNPKSDKGPETDNKNFNIGPELG